MLQRRFEADQRWSEFVARRGRVKARIQQTSDAFPLARIKAALEATPVKHVVGWCHEHLPSTVQSQRRLAFVAPPP